MSHSSNAQSARRAPPFSAISLHDWLLSLFRHKGFVIGCTTLGLLTAIGVGLLKPPLYVSRAKLLLHYAGGPRDVDPKELEILTSLDIATQAVATVGAEKIVGKERGVGDSAAAVGQVDSGIEAFCTNSPILTVAFKTRRKDVCQPVLEAVIHAYMVKHLEVYTGPEILDEYGVKDLKEKLEHAESDLNVAKLQAGVPPNGDPIPDYPAQITNTEHELDRATRDLAEKQRAFAATGCVVGIPASTLRDYKGKAEQLLKLENEERDLLWRGYKETHPLIQAVRGQLRKLSADKAGLEKDYPNLKQVVDDDFATTHSLSPAEAAKQLADIQQLNAQVTSLAIALTNLQTQVMRAAQWQPRIAQLQNERDRLRSSYDTVVTRLAKAMENVTPKDNDVIKISVLQNPSPPQLELKQTFQLALGLLAACVALGLVGAFVLDRFVDRSIKGVSDVERRLGVSLFLAIPDASKNANSSARANLVTRPPNGSGNALRTGNEETERRGSVRSVKADRLGEYAAGLRERVWTYFETRELGFKKPKLVGVAGCGRGTGVSTIASGLATELSKAGEGSVLLVDISGDKRASQPFYVGKPGCRVSEVVQAETAAGGRGKEGLQVTSLDDSTEATTVSRGLSAFVPKLKGSDYDYIVFDLPPVASTSPTPRLASQMDLTLIMLQAERTEIRAAAEAVQLLREARVTFAVVLNKCSRKVPHVLLANEVEMF